MNVLDDSEETQSSLLPFQLSFTYRFKRHDSCRRRDQFITNSFKLFLFSDWCPYNNLWFIPPIQRPPE